MEYETFVAEAKIEEFHWWYVVRRKLFQREISKAGVAKQARILDVGTSTGTNLRMLRDGGYTNFSGLDFSPVAIRFCAEKGLGRVEQGDVCNLPFESETFDLVLATDIVEHVDDDRAAVSEIHRILKRGGKALFTVPAFPQLWGLQDEVSLHKRRYYKRQFLDLMQEAGFTVLRQYYFNYLLFIPIWMARRLIRIFKVRAKSENHFNTGLLNRILSAVFSFDVLTAEKLRPPFGVSAFCLVEKQR